MRKNGAISYDDIRKLVEKALSSFYFHDKQLFDYETEDKAVAERCMVFHIGWYLRDLMKKDKRFRKINIDCEYNRNFKDVKAMINHNEERKNIIPDLLIHKRGKAIDNILVIEFKKGIPNERDKEWDEEKLKYFTDQSKEYAYKYGFYVFLKKQFSIVYVYENGEKIGCMKITK